MADQEYDEMMARYFAQMENISRERLAEAADLITKFTALAASKRVILGAASFEYIQTTGIVAKAQRVGWDEHSEPHHQTLNRLRPLKITSVATTHGWGSLRSPPPYEMRVR